LMIELARLSVTVEGLADYGILSDGPRGLYNLMFLVFADFR
jgi:hypothetical protein